MNTFSLIKYGPVFAESIILQSSSNDIKLYLFAGVHVMTLDHHAAMFRDKRPEESILQGHPQVVARYKRQAVTAAPVVGINVTQDSSKTNSVNTQSPHDSTSVSPADDNITGVAMQGVTVSNSKVTTENTAASKPNSAINTQNSTAQNEPVSNENMSHIVTTSQSSTNTNGNIGLNDVVTTVQSPPTSLVPAPPPVTLQPLVPNLTTAQPGHVITTAGM